MQIPDKFKKMAVAFQRALKTNRFEEIDSIPLEDLRLAKAHLIPDKKFPYYSLLLDKIKERESTAVQQGFRVPEISSNFSKNKDVFLAHRFAEAELIGKLKMGIEEAGYKWKEGRRDNLGSISEDILTKIKNCGFFVVLMTKKDKLESGKFTVSSWLLEEKGAALAFGHRPLIMVEEGIDRDYVGFLQSDDEMIFFERTGFEKKIKEAIKKINNTYDRHCGITTLHGTGSQGPVPQLPSVVDPIQADILKVLAMGDDAGVFAEQLAQHFQMPVIKIKHYLDTLADEELIVPHRRVGQPPKYYLGKKGRAYLVQSEII